MYGSETITYMNTTLWLVYKIGLNYTFSFLFSLPWAQDHVAMKRTEELEAVYLMKIWLLGRVTVLLAGIGLAEE
jgi:hypothetical protein